MEDLNFNPDNFRDFDARLEHVDYLYNTGQMNELDKTDDVDDTLHLMDLIKKFNAKELIEYKDIITYLYSNILCLF